MDNSSDNGGTEIPLETVAAVVEGETGRGSFTDKERDTQINSCHFCAEGGIDTPVLNISYRENPMMRQLKAK